MERAHKYHCQQDLKIYRYLIYKSKFYLSQASLFKLYYSLIYPYLYYGNLAWGGTYQTTLDRLCVLQKRIVRIITKSQPYAHTAPLFQQYKILNIANIQLLKTGLFMFAFNKKLLPESFHTMFQKSSDIHNYSTRQANKLRSHKCRINIRKFTIAYQGPIFWNSLPVQLKSKAFLNSFRRHLKDHLIQST